MTGEKQQKNSGFPGIVISALKGGSGKTIFSIGVTAALKKLGKKVAPFKKGPDYIDAGWLALAANTPCYNLDTFLIPSEHIIKSFRIHTLRSDIALIEGNRGIYDCIDTSGRTSTAELAKLLNLPIILCIDCTKMTRTTAAVISGCSIFDPTANIKGVILNKVAGSRHENIIRKSINESCENIEVVGAIPKLKEQNFPERHMGLVPTHEYEWAKDSIDAACETAQKYMDIEAIIKIAGASDNSNLFDYDDLSNKPFISNFRSKMPKVAVMKDSAFQFYYPENIEALEQAGAEIIYISPLNQTEFPDIDALYIGGGFPETHAEQLSRNNSFREKLREKAERGLPIYAECGGLMYLGKELVLGDNCYPMAGVLHLSFGFSQKPQGHGYTIVQVDRPNPYFENGTILKGHEFHYSKVMNWDDTENTVFSMKRGVGIEDKRDGICYKNVLATYTHIHALSVESWAAALVENAQKWAVKESNLQPPD